VSRNPTAERVYGFKPRVKIGKSKHSWESHADAGTLMKDVLHWLDFLAAQNPNRFIFSGLPALLEMCNKRRVRNNLKPVGMRHLKKALAFLRDWHIISPYFTAWDGRYGFIFEPHDARRSEEHGVCIKHAQMNPYGDLPEPPDGARRGTQRALQEHSKGHSEGTARGTQRAPLVAPEDVFSGTIRGTVRGTDDSAKPIDCVELTDEQVAKWMTENVQADASKVIRLYGSNAVGSEGLIDGRSAKRLNGREEKDQKQERVSEVVSSGEPRTEEAKPKAKQPGRKRDVLSADEYDRAKTERSLAEEKAEYESRPLCAKCGFKHYPDKACIQITEPKRKKS
jgi:hypothetical protein